MDLKMQAIKFNDVWEMYRIRFVSEGKASWENFWALSGITFNIRRGECVGIIGENGSGKTTILKLIMGMLAADRGEVITFGRVSGLLELGAGFQPELTGSENIYLNAGLFGFSKQESEAIYPEIVNFAELGKFINAPVKCYSQGMFVRLAFSIAIHVNPDTLLIDDTLAVGDEYFQRKCIKKILEIKEQGKTIVFVTHDTSMLTRICERAILLKHGKIIKDDLIESVIAFSNQTIGVKEGVAILKSGHLSIVFNNGRLLFNWKDKLITPGLGAHTVLAISGKYYNSVQAEWALEESSENKLIATGVFQQLNVKQVWRLELGEGLQLKWDIEISLADYLGLSEYYVNIIAVSSYCHWFTGIEEGVFPPINEKNNNWQPFLNTNISRKVVGLESVSDTDLYLPSLIFEEDSNFTGIFAQILNADYLSNCRVLQYKIAGLDNRLALQANQADIFSGKITFDAVKEQYLEQVNQECVLSFQDARLIFTNGVAIIYFGDLILTKNSHLHTSFYTDGKWYNSNSGHWEFKKEGEHKITAYGLWSGLAVKQIWEFEVDRDYGFSWKVWLEIDKEINIQEQRLQFMCIGDYKYYFSDYSEGEFPDSFSESEFDLLQKCIPSGVIEVSAQEGYLPDLSLDLPFSTGTFAKILNSDFYNKARLLRFERVESEEQSTFSPGKYLSFAIKGRLMIGSAKKKKRFSNTLDNGKLRFIFRQGSGAIFWNERELTKRLGFYTSVRSQGRWHDSSSAALWKIEESGENIIRARGNWFNLGVSQIWEIKLREESLIEFEVILEVRNRIVVERLQANLMLSERYTGWLSKKQNGIFPSFTADMTDDWQLVYCADGEAEFIGASSGSGRKESLPDILVAPGKINSGWLLCIVNSDCYHRGRVLQYLNSQNIIIEPGKYPYACGTISIDKKDYA
jgi:ABC-type polysaccharide/polyol phosphate transport system ATPase subunit